MNKIKKMIFINIIIAIFIMITGFTSISYAADLKLNYNPNNKFAPFKEAMEDKKLTFCRNHAKHTTKYTPITYVLDKEKNMNGSTLKLFSDTRITKNEKLVQDIVWYLNSSRKSSLKNTYNTLAEENSSYAGHTSVSTLKGILNDSKYKNTSSEEYDVSVSKASVIPKLSTRPIYDKYGKPVYDTKADGTRGEIRKREFYVIKVYKSVTGYTDNITVNVYPYKDGKKIDKPYTQYKPNSTLGTVAQRVGEEGEKTRIVTDNDDWMTILIRREDLVENPADGFYIEISATAKNRNGKGVIQYYKPTKVTINGNDETASKYLKNAQKLLRYDIDSTTNVSSDHTIAEIANDSEKSVKYIKSIEDENGKVVASVDNKKLKEPTISYDTSEESDSLGKVSYSSTINTTVMNGYTITYGIRYYSTGIGERTLSENFEDTYSPGLIYQKIEGAELMNDPQKVVEDEDGNKTITVEAPNKTLNGYGTTGATSKKDGTGIQSGFEYYDVFLTFKVDLSKAKNPDTILQFKNNDVTVNRGYEITGKVFIDEKSIIDGKKTGPRDNLLGENDTLVSGIKVELIDNQGNIVQIKDKITGIEYPNTVYTNDKGEYKFTHLPTEGKYQVKFTYNGQEYENVKYEENPESRNSSYAEENNSDYDFGSRKILNRKFTTINGSNSEEYSLKSESAKLPQVTGATNKSNASQAEFAISSYSEIIGLTTSYKEYLNLGIFKRHFDLSLENKLESMEIAINGVTQKIDSINGGVINGSILYEDLYLKKSDYNYTNVDDKNKELTVYLNYQLTIRNNSYEKFTGTINSINFWYDSRLGPDIAENQSDEMRLGGIVDGGDSRFQKCGINLAGKKVEPNESIIVNVRLKLDRETIANCINETNDTLKTFETVAEISSYGSEYSSNNVFGNGHSGNAGKIDDNSNAGNLDIQKYVSEIRKNTDANTVLNFFDEDDAKSSLGIKLQVDDIQRKLSGRVFEDKTTHYKKKNTRLGDGKYKENDDKSIPNVTVELLELEENTPETVYVLGDNREWKLAETHSDGNGNYTIEGFIPSKNYIIRFTYGDGSTGIYNAQDYKSTIDTTEEDYKNVISTEMPNGADNYWYTHEKIKNKSVAKDDDTKMKQKTITNSEAIKLEDYTEAASDETTFKNTATTAKFCAPIRWAGNTETSRDENYGGTKGIQNMNLGLAERPRSELTVNKIVDHITITTADGRTLIDGSQGAINSTSWTDRYVQAIVDENLIYGSTLKITYKYVVENIGEVDYLSNGRVAYNRDGTIVANNTNRRYYDYGDLQGQQAKTKTYVEKIIDYVDNQLMYDENMQSNPENAEKINKDDWHVATEDELNMLGEDAKEGAKDINTKLITESPDKKLEPGEKTDPIYLTVSKVLSSGEDKDKNELVYNNYVEIIKSWNTAGRRSYSITGNKLLSDVTNEKRGAPIINEDDVKKKAEYILSIPGDLNPKTLITLDYEPDSDKAQEVQIVPPFGSQRVIWTIIATISAIILAGGIYLINRKVLKARNKK